MVAGPVLAQGIDDRIAELERQLAALKAQVAAHDESITDNSRDIEEARPVAAGTSMRYGGFIQLDGIASNYSEGKPASALIDDFVVGSLIPVEPSSGDADAYSDFNLHAKSSRFFFTTKTRTDAGAISTRLELDFMLSPGGDERISNSWNSRLRHAFVNWEYGEGRSLMAGQSWSTFFNVGALPDVLDFVGPVGTIFVRQPQIRWTSGPLQLSLENPATRLNESSDGGVTTRLDDVETLPDIIARYNGEAGELSWSVAALGRQLSYEARSGSAVEVADDSRFGYGLSLAGKWTLGRDDLRFMFSYGDALGRYLGLNAYNDGYIDAGGNIETIDQWGGFIAYQHYWSDAWRSTFSLSASAADNPGRDDFSAAGSLASEYQSVHANLNWLPAPKLQIGGEYSYGRKELEDGRKGDLNRLQFAVKYAF
ncbi:porin [Parahaliea mediterranea]|uniref:Porin n=2 Tax=Parahaliea mediterranea TaxID=651086 RepID=A0A939DEH2_9GAMM|nr:porin [Parahaliea mediterranea]